MIPERMVRGRKNPLHFGLAKRLRALRRERDIGGKPLSVAAHLAATTVLRIESEETVPSIDVVEKLASALKVSAGFLAYGVSPAAHAPVTIGSSELSERLRTTRLLRGLSLNGLAKLSGVARTTIGYLEAGTTTPSVATAELLAQALGVPAPWLAYGEGHAAAEDDRPGESAWAAT